MLPTLISRYLVPDQRPAAPSDFELIDEKITDGLPHSIRLDTETSLVVIVPTGLASAWQNADPTAVVTSCDRELQPVDSATSDAVADASRDAALLLVQRNAAIEGALSLTVANRRKAPATGDAPGAHIEIVVLSWDIRAGNMRGPGDYGSRIVLAWRRADLGVSQYSVLPLNPHVLRRLLMRQLPPDMSAEIRRRLRPIESTVGPSVLIEARSFQINQAIRRVLL